ncbi:MAG TPA: hypothetical protein VFQ55_12160 [Casimicrobiaceae bacterium]|nr:hypothetical protein [Casimicrobiaceae bacterium]
MAVLMVLLVVVDGVAVWAYVRTSPRAAPAGPLALYNGALLLAAAAAAWFVGRALYLDAVVVKAGHAGMPMALSVMAAGTVFLVVLALGGVARNFFVFPGAAHGRGRTPS